MNRLASAQTFRAAESQAQLINARRRPRTVRVSCLGKIVPSCLHEDFFEQRIRPLYILRLDQDRMSQLILRVCEFYDRSVLNPVGSELGFDSTYSFGSCMTRGEEDSQPGREKCTCELFDGAP